MRSVTNLRLTIVLALSVVSTIPTFAGLVVQSQSFRLLDGRLLRGPYDQKSNGLFHHTMFGGKLYRWRDIDATSLPTVIRERVRDRLLSRLDRANAKYESGDIDRAQPLFRTVVAALHFLSDDDRKRTEFIDIRQKAHGLVLHDGVWMPFADRQRLLGLQHYRGNWLPIDDVAEHKAFKHALRNARNTDDHAQAMVDLRALMDQYPNSSYTEAAEQVIETLLARAVARQEFEATVRALKRQEYRARRERASSTRPTRSRLHVNQSCPSSEHTTAHAAQTRHRVRF